LLVTASVLSGTLLLKETSTWSGLRPDNTRGDSRFQKKSPLANVTPQTARQAAKVLSTTKFRDRGPKYKDSWLVISQTLELAVNIVPKVMCSSIRRAFNTLECQNSTVPRCAEIRKNPLLRSVDVSNMTRVAFVRDPFERALSAYENSDINGLIRINHCHNTSVCTFTEWVLELAKNPEKSFDNEHFLPQTNALQLNQMRYHYIFRLSSSIDQHFFWNTLCKQKKIIKANTSHKNLENETFYTGLEYFTDNTFKHLSNLYAEDLELWAKLLHYGTPKESNEHTIYDYFISEYNSTN